jgi:hypothetical protein
MAGFVRPIVATVVLHKVVSMVIDFTVYNSCFEKIVRLYYRFLYYENGWFQGGVMGLRTVQKPNRSNIDPLWTSVPGVRKVRRYLKNGKKAISYYIRGCISPGDDKV